VLTPEELARPGTEQANQIALFAWASTAQAIYPQLRWLHAIPNANSHRMVAEGVRSGISDIYLPYPKFDNDIECWYHGLYIEMKTEKRRNQKNGGLSDDQIEFIDYAERVGYKCEVCYSWEEARDKIKEYLNGNTINN